MVFRVPCVRVRSFCAELCDGIALLKVLDQLLPGSVPWSKISLGTAWQRRGALHRQG